MELHQIDIVTLIERETGRSIPARMQGKKEIKTPCPWCGGEDRFEITPASGLWRCRDNPGNGCGKAGNAIQFIMEWRGVGYNEACDALRLKQYKNTDGKKHVSKTDLAKLPDTPVIDETPPPTKSAPDIPTLDGYARAHGVPGYYLVQQGWKEITWNKRPALEIPSSDGNPRIRYLDKKGYCRKESGHGEICWYRFPSDDPELKPYVFLTNGQISVEAARFAGMQAFSVTDGEKALPDARLAELKDLLKLHPETTVVIALDADDAGRKATQEIANQLVGERVLLIDFGGQNGYDLADFLLDNPAEPYAKLLALSRKPPSHIVTGADAAASLMRSLQSNALITPGQSGEYLPIPWKSLHKFGGMCHVIHPGKVAMIIAPSGHGKTSMLETWVDYWLRVGYDVIWRGDEWTETEYTIRRTQRYGGMTMNDYALHHIWAAEMRLSGNTLHGVRLPEELRQKSINILKSIQGWKGNIYYLPPARDVETTQAQATALTHLLRRKGRRVAVMVWDYLTLFDSAASDKEGNRPETVLGSIKNWTMRTQIVSLVASQITKGLTRLMSGEEYQLSSADALYAREDKVNALLGIEPVYHKTQDARGNSYGVFQNMARLRVLKNSIGGKTVEGNGFINIKANFKYLSWAEYQSQNTPALEVSETAQTGA